MSSTIAPILAVYLGHLRAQDAECVLVFDGDKFVMDLVSVVGVSAHGGTEGSNFVF